MIDNFLQINIGHQVTDPGNSENTKQDKCKKKKKKIQGISYLNLRKSKIKKKLERSQIKKIKTLTYSRAWIKIAFNFSSETMQATQEWCDIFKVLKEKYSKLEF